MIILFSKRKTQSMCLIEAYYKQNQLYVEEAIRRGEFDRLETTENRLMEECIVMALDLKVIQASARSFPDYRKQEEIEIPMEVLLCAAVAAPFVKIHSFNRLPYALTSSSLLSRLGYTAQVKMEGISNKSEGKTGAFHGDSLRKTLVLLEEEKGAKEGACEMEGWYNNQAGPQFERVSKGKTRLKILDCTGVEVPLEAKDYEMSEVVTNDKGETVRGYKIASIRQVTNKAGITTAVHIGSIRPHDLEFCKDFVLTTPALKAGDLLVEDRAFLDANLISQLKKKRSVDILIPLKENMLAFKKAVELANTDHTHKWQENPARKDQQIKKVCNIGDVWEGMEVSLNACVVRKKNKKREKDLSQPEYIYIVFATTDLSLTAKQIIRNYQLRWEIETEHQLIKRPDFGLNLLTSKRYVHIVFHFIRTFFAYSLFELFTASSQGKAFEGMTLEQAELVYRQAHTQSQVIIFKDSFFALFMVEQLLLFCLELSSKAQKRLKERLTLVIQNKYGAKGAFLCKT